MSHVRECQQCGETYVPANGSCPTCAAAMPQFTIECGIGADYFRFRADVEAPDLAAAKAMAYAELMETFESNSWHRATPLVKNEGAPHAEHSEAPSDQTAREGDVPGDGGARRPVRGENGGRG